MFKLQPWILLNSHYYQMCGMTNPEEYGQTFSHSYTMFLHHRQSQDQSLIQFDIGICFHKFKHRNL